MDREIEESIESVRKRFDDLNRHLGLEKKKEEMDLLEEKMSVSTFWDNAKEAEKVIHEMRLLKGWIQPVESVKKRLNDVEMLYQESVSSDDTSLLEDIKQEVALITKNVDELEVKRMLGGELDSKGCYLSINAGAGGTESCDWAAMLSRMYSRWAQSKGWPLKEVDRSEGDVTGIKSVTFEIKAPFAYGYAKAEKGVHRLVRISPFDSNAKRHTSFASVEVTPEIDEAIEIVVPPEDIRIDTFRASGAGGQHVNRTDSAVRITHLKTGIVVSCQQERSQLQNKETCFKMLRSKLYEKEVTERKRALEEIQGEKKSIGWGSQIRNYVFQPYTLVKDARTRYEEGNIQKVMDGDLDPFIYAYLKQFGDEG